MFTFDEKNYELKYSVKRIDLIESATKKPIMANLVNNNAMLSLADLKLYFAYGLKNTEDGAYVSPSQGTKYAEEELDKGYPEMLKNVVEALEKDCPFLFQAD